MARQPFQGLFQGPSVGDVMSLRNKERDTRIRQAFADSAGAGGGFFANRMAKLAQQQQEAIRGAGQHIGSYFAPGLINEDPRLTKARKRDTDKVEIQGILGKFTDLSSDGGPNITEKELQIGFSELMKRGYPEEAQRFLSMSQSKGGERRADIKSGLEQDKFKLDKFLGKEGIDIQRGNLAINQFNARHRQKIDWATLGVKKDDLKTKRDISYAQLAWDKNKFGQSQDEIERSNKAREALRQTGHDINQEGNLIKWKQVNDSDRINTEKLAQTDRDFKLRSRISDFERSFKTKSFEWEKEMNGINNDLKKQGLEIRREGNRIQLVGIEARADTAKASRQSREKIARDQINAKLTIAEDKIISAEELSKLNRVSREAISKARDKTSLEIANIKSKPKQKEIKTVTKDDRAEILSHINGTEGLKEKMKSSFGETAWYQHFAGLNSDSVSILTSKAKTIRRHYSNAGQQISLSQALDLLVSGTGSEEKEDKPEANTTANSVPQVTIEEIED